MAEERNVDKVKKLEYELGRYKKAVQTRDNEINKLKDEIKGHCEAAMIFGAYMSLFIEKQGGEIEISMDKLKERIGKYEMQINPNYETMTYHISAKKINESGE